MMGNTIFVIVWWMTVHKHEMNAGNMRSMMQNICNAMHEMWRDGVGPNLVFVFLFDDLSFVRALISPMVFNGWTRFHWVLLHEMKWWIAFINANHVYMINFGCFHVDTKKTPNWTKVYNIIGYTRNVSNDLWKPTNRKLKHKQNKEIEWEIIVHMIYAQQTVCGFREPLIHRPSRSIGYSFEAFDIGKFL